MIDYNFQNDWMMVKARGTIPKEIVSFLESTFMIMEIRERVGEIRGIKFEIRTKEGNHIIPHIHAAYDKYNVSIEIETGKILAGNLPRPQQKIASDWVVRNRENLLGKWNSISFAATSVLTKSRIQE